MRLGRYQNAVDDIDTALNLKPDYAELKSAKGFILEKMNKYEEAQKFYHEAIVCYEKRLKINPSSVNSLTDIAFLTMLINNRDTGIIEYEKLCKRFPNDKRIIMLHDAFYTFDRKNFIDSYCE